MISAEEAYRMTSNLAEKRIKRIQNKINRKIKRQIRRGRYSLSVCYECFINSEIRVLVLKYYRNMGYSAKMGLARYDIYAKHYELSISWQNPQNVDGVASGVRNEENENPEN